MPWWAVIPAMGMQALAKGQGGTPGGGALNQQFKQMMWDASNVRANYANTKREGGDMPQQTFAFPKGYPAGPGRNQAFQTLTEILGRQGKTDPMAMNQLLAGIQRGTQTTQSGLQQSLARAGPGMQQSGVGQALNTAIGQAGEGRKARAVATENQLAEDRKRQDLMMWLQMVVDPSLTSYGIREGVAAQRYQGDMMKQGAQWNALSNLAGAGIANLPDIIKILKGGGGGGGGGGGQLGGGSTNYGVM